MTKPVKNQIKESAQEHPGFGKACVRLGREINRMTTRLKMANMNIGARDVKLQPLNEQQAIRRAAEALSEVFVFGIFGTVVIGQWYAGEKEEEGYRHEIHDQLADMKQSLDEMR